MKKSIKLLVVITVMVALIGSFVAVNGFRIPPEKITILTTSDFQSQITPFKTKVYINGVKTKIMVGGAARLVGTVKELKKKNGPKKTVFFTSGDDFIGPVFRAFGGVPTTFMWDQIADAWEPGNHEFDLGPETLGKALDYSTVPMICANLDVSNEPALKGKIKPDMIKKVGDVKLGIFGLITPNINILTNLGKNVKVNPDLVSVANEEVKKLKKEGANVIVAITHIGVDADKDLASKVNGIDVIVGGHSHTLIKKPIVVKNPDGGQTIIVQDGAKAAYLGELSLYVSDWGRGKVESYEWKLHLLDDSVPVDPFTQKLVDYFEAKMPPPEKVGETLVDLDARKSVVRTREAAIGDLFTDAMNYAVGTKIAVTNGGGIRGDKIYPKGEITTATLTQMHPFGNSIVIVQLTGKQFKEVLERGAAALRSKNDPRDPKTIDTGAFLQVAGLKEVIDVDKTPQQLDKTNSKIVVPGERVVSVTIDGEPLDPDEIYTVAVNDYIAHGGDGYVTLGNLPDSAKNFTYVYLTDALYKYIKAHSPIAPKVEGRIIIKGELAGFGD